MVNRNELEKQVEEYPKLYINRNFEFREYQKDIIVDILENILNEGKKCHVIQAPTGSGKSLINIISAGVLDKYYNMRSFILASDLSLWEQYYDFIVKHRKLEFGTLKGLDNYKCIKNDHGLHEAECKISGYSFNQLFNSSSANALGFSCASCCRYIKDRKKALKSNVTLLTYHLYLYLVGSNYMDSRGPCFDTRDVIFCDECHNIPDIMQLRYQFSIKRKHLDNLLYIYDQLDNFQLELFNESEIQEEVIKLKEKYPTKDILIEQYNNKYNELIDYRKTNEQDYKIIQDILAIWDTFCDFKNLLEESIHEKMKLKKQLSKEDYKTLAVCKKFQAYVSESSIKMYLDIIKTIGVEYLVKSLVEIEDGDKICNLQCAKEDYLVYKGLLSVTPYKVMLSATIGDKDNFEDTIGVKYCEGEDKEILFDDIPSTFNFKESPIYFLNRYKMSFNERDNSIKKLKPIIYKILNGKLKDKKGMIQTGTYAIAKSIIDDAPPEIKSRLLYYNGSKEKSNVIAMHQMHQNTVLIGPTLNEGIDLPGDECRFILILKMPYPSIKDRLVSAKINLFPHWYNSITSNQIIQGIGRGNRFIDDWCITYILDACFLKLYIDTINQYPKEMQERVKIYQ